MMTLNDVAEVCGVSPNSLNDWIQNGFIEPAERLGEGRGKGYRFSVAQVVALMYGVNLKKLGAGRPMVRDAVAQIASLGEDGLRAALAEGRRVWWPEMGLTPVPPAWRCRVCWTWPTCSRS